MLLRLLLAFSQYTSQLSGPVDLLLHKGGHDVRNRMAYQNDKLRPPREACRPVNLIASIYAMLTR